MAGRVQVKTSRTTSRSSRARSPAAPTFSRGSRPAPAYLAGARAVQQFARHFGTAVHARQPAREKQDVKATLPLMSNKEVRKAYQAGKLPGMNAPESIADVASRKLAGARVAFDAQEAMKAELAKGGFDWEKGDINKFVFDRMPRLRPRSSGTTSTRSPASIETMGRLPAEARRGTHEAGDGARPGRSAKTTSSKAISLAVDKAVADGKSPDEPSSRAQRADSRWQAPRARRASPSPRPTSCAPEGGADGRRWEEPRPRDRAPLNGAHRARTARHSRPSRTPPLTKRSARSSERRRHA
jgi:hypothetical protein